jgi:nucleoside-diphosphate-sugar epimerase
MAVLVTGSSGHLGEALVRSLRDRGERVTGLDVLPSPYTTVVGSVADRDCIARCMEGVDTVLHAATLHKPHVATHSAQAFVDTNVNGTLALLEAAVAAGVRAFVFTSTTSAFGHALRPPPDRPAAWVTEELRPVPRNIYGVTKTAAEDLCELVHRQHGLPCVVLRTSRFFPEEDDDAAIRQDFPQDNVRANELLFRRVDLEDVVAAHLCAIERAPAIGFDRFIVSATTPFRPEDASDLRNDAPAVLRRRVPSYEAIYRERGWRMFQGIDRVYDNARAREHLGWRPLYDFERLLARLQVGREPWSPLTQAVGSKGYHVETFGEGPYPVG